MLRRSKDNKKAALLLMGKRNYDGSVVAFYYSVLQRMMYSLNETERIPLSYDLQKPLDGNIHYFVLNEVRRRIVNKKDSENFKDLFEDLFSFRKKADYEEASITQEECVECRAIYENLIYKLDRFFPIKAE